MATRSKILGGAGLFAAICMSVGAAGAARAADAVEPKEKVQLFDGKDTAAAPPRVVIADSLARTLWPNGDAVGRPLAMQLYNGITPTVAGVVRDVHLLDARTPPRPVAYLSASRFPSTVRDLVVRVENGSEAFVPSLRAAVASIDPSLP